jgi:CheY-like chemotaxis protein
VQPILLTAKAGQCLSIALHELTTNAAKYGALTSQQGCVRVDSVIDESMQPPMMKFVWTEYGGPAVVIPQKRGVGTDLLEQVIRFELSGETSFHFDVSGLKCEILIPWTSSVGSIGSSQSIAMTLRGSRILLIEDTALVADEMHHMLNELGCVVVGPAASFNKALQLVETSQYDAVLLDVDLGGEKAWPIADELMSRNKPFVLTTGFACPDSLPSEFQELVYLEKPFDQIELGKKLIEAITRPSNSR